MRKRALLLVFAVALASCSGASGESTTSTTLPGSTSTTVTGTAPVLSTTSTSLATATTGPTGATSTIPVADVVIAGGTSEAPEVSVTGPEVFMQKLGETFEVRVLSSIDDEIHVHGYDLHFDTSAGQVTVVSFPAEVPGIFEVELEGQGVLLFEIEVAP